MNLDILSTWTNKVFRLNYGSVLTVLMSIIGSCVKTLHVCVHNCSIHLNYLVFELMLLAKLYIWKPSASYLLYFISDWSEHIYSKLPKYFDMKREGISEKKNEGRFYY